MWLPMSHQPKYVPIILSELYKIINSDHIIETEVDSI